MPITTTDLLSIKEVAEVLGVEPKSARLYHEVAQRHRREGRVRDKDMPAPDMRIGNNTPLWHRATITAWQARRGPTPRRTETT